MINCSNHSHFYGELIGCQSRCHTLFQVWMLGQKWVTCVLSKSHTPHPNTYDIDAIQRDKKVKAHILL